MNGIRETGEECDSGTPDDECLCNCRRAADEFFADDVVPEVKITVSESVYSIMDSCSRNDYDTDPRPEKCNYQAAVCHIKYLHHETTASCGVRRKGHASWRESELNDRPALKVKLDKSWRGMRKFTFNNMAQDSTYSRERISYRMHRLIGQEGMPKANTMKLKFVISGRDRSWETYSNIQTPDRSFLGERFLVDGTLWDMVIGSNIRVGLGSCGNNSPLKKMECQEGCDDTDPDKLLRGLVDVAGSCGGAKSVNLNNLWAKLDKIPFLRHNALDRFMSNWDSFCGNRWSGGNNYHIYYNGGTEKFEIFPWGNDQSLQSSSQPSKPWHECHQMEACMRNDACNIEYDAAYDFVLDTMCAHRAELRELVALIAQQTGKRENRNVLDLLNTLRC
jgi:spore coat protein CotH